MAAPQSCHPSFQDGFPPEPGSGRVDCDRSGDGRRLVARMLDLPPAESPWFVPALIEMVKGDMLQQWRAGRRVGLESYLGFFPELGSPETVPAELILAECEARRRSGAAVDLVEFKRRFPRQAGALREAFEPPPRSTPEADPREHSDPAGAGPRHWSSPPPEVPRVPSKLVKQFGRYGIVRRLGRGSMGSVYLAHDIQLDRRVALKVPHFWPDGGEDGPNHLDLDRFYREAHRQ